MDKATFSVLLADLMINMLEAKLLALIEDEFAGLAGATDFVYEHECIYCHAFGDTVKNKLVLGHKEDCPIRQAREMLHLILKDGKYIEEEK